MIVKNDASRAACLRDESAIADACGYSLGAARGQEQKRRRPDAPALAKPPRSATLSRARSRQSALTRRAFAGRIAWIAVFPSRKKARPAAPASRRCPGALTVLSNRRNELVL